MEGNSTIERYLILKDRSGQLNCTSLRKRLEPRISKVFFECESKDLIPGDDENSDDSGDDDSDDNSDSKEGDDLTGSAIPSRPVQLPVVAMTVGFIYLAWYF